MTFRTFIAVEIPAGIQSALAQSTAPLKNIIPKTSMRWVPPQNVHLTLKFLGDISSSGLERLAETLKLEVALHEMFSMSVGGLGAFPSVRRARVIWVGLEAPSTLESLQRGVEAATARLGYAVDERPFSAHLTIGRVGQNAKESDLQSIHKALESTKIGVIGQIRVEAIHIFKSDLRPGGSVYTDLYTLPMRPD